MDLPVEVRVKILRLVLHTKPLELWPETGEPDGSFKIQIAYFRRYKKDTTGFSGCLPVQLLQCCKQLNQEAGEIFYGENAFNFSAPNGWVVANAFFYTIGPRHYQWIKHLTLPVPFLHKEQEVYYMQHKDMPVDFMSKPQFIKWQIVYVDRHLTMPPGLKAEDAAWKSFNDVCLILSKCGKLCDLKLVLPSWFLLCSPNLAPWELRSIEGPPIMQSEWWKVLDRMTRSLPGLKVCVVRMADYDTAEARAYPKRHARLLRRVVERGWDIKIGSKVHPLLYVREYRNRCPKWLLYRRRYWILPDQAPRPHIQQAVDIYPAMEGLFNGDWDRAWMARG